MRFDPNLQSSPRVAAPVATAEPRGRIGDALERARQRLLDMTGAFDGAGDETTRLLITESRNVLERRTCRIAVIGQIKAGKSTFINALAGRPGLLPADINPWTAVVTLLQFRDGEAAPSPAARFQMFTASEWEALAEGGGRLRQLTERLIPGFRPDLLRAQFAQMRDRAQMRLGPSFERLLGQTHAFDALSRELLVDYISAGEDALSQSTGRRCYSDITRTAELFFSQGPFAFPTTLIDTPGINDPFLVRDEITRRTLENPDIFLFVISALQPLAAADIALLRLITGLQKDRILVFINRIDQLPDPAADGMAVAAEVSARLRAEFPTLDIPVVAGSAAWANMALNPGGRDLPLAMRTLRPDLLAAFGAEPLPASLSNAPRAAVDAAVSHAFYTIAGMPRIAAELDRLMGSSASAAQLGHIAACLCELGKARDLACSLELRSLGGLLQAHRAEAAKLQDQMQQERHMLADLDTRAAHFHTVLDEIETHLLDIVSRGIGPLVAELDAIVLQFAHDKAEAVERSLRRRDAREKWVCNVMPLREALESCYLATCQRLGAEISAIERQIEPVLRQAVEHLAPGSAHSFDARDRGMTLHRPNVQPLRQTVVLDLGSSWWKAWLPGRPDPTERAETLRAMIEHDFRPITAELAREADSYFGWYIAQTLDRSRAVAESVLLRVRRRNEALIHEFEAWQRGVSDGTGDFENRQSQRTAGLSAEQARIRSIVQELQALLARLPQVTTTPTNGN